MHLCIFILYDVNIIIWMSFIMKNQTSVQMESHPHDKWTYQLHKINLVGLTTKYTQNSKTRPQLNLIACHVAENPLHMRRNHFFCDCNRLQFHCISDNSFYTLDINNISFYSSQICLMQLLFVLFWHFVLLKCTIPR